MRKSIRDWKNFWMKTNGETDGLEVVIEDSKRDNFASCVYKGSFKDIPEDLLDNKVIECCIIIQSSVPERIGAYALVIDRVR